LLRNRRRNCQRHSQSSQASAAGDIGDAGGVAVVGDVPEDTLPLATARGFGLCGLATCLGASTTTLGSVVAPPEGATVCDMAVLLGPHSSSAIDKTATAGPATKWNDAFMAIFS
jgi:hypothetical protein